MAYPTYTNEQMQAYYKHIGFSPPENEPCTLATLAVLQLHQLQRVPFESVSLHYSQARHLSIDPEDLFDKIVRRGRGGYCMELNRFFSTVLRTLGVRHISVGGRVWKGDGYTGWSHMVNLVRLPGDTKIYLVDVGYGSNVPPHPVPLEDGAIFTTIGPGRGKLERRATVSGYSDLDDVGVGLSPLLWVYSFQPAPDAPWTEQYCVLQHEFLPQDFAVMNLSTMSSPASLFVKTVLAVRILTEGEGEGKVATAAGMLMLVGDVVKRRMGGDKSEVLATLGNEDERVAALEKWFGIRLSASERSAIEGLPSQLMGKPESV